MRQLEAASARSHARCTATRRFRGGPQAAARRRRLADSTADPPVHTRAFALCSFPPNKWERTLRCGLARTLGATALPSRARRLAQPRSPVVRDASRTSVPRAVAAAETRLGANGPGDADATFYFDLASPLAYLRPSSRPAPSAPSRALGAHPRRARHYLRRRLTAVLSHAPAPRSPAKESPPQQLPRTAITRTAHDLESTHPETPAPDERADVERRAAALGLQPVRWPTPFPFDSEPAMRVATYAAQIGAASRSRKRPSARLSRAGARSATPIGFWSPRRRARCTPWGRAHGDGARILCQQGRPLPPPPSVPRTGGAREVPCVLKPEPRSTAARTPWTDSRRSRPCNPPPAVPPLAIIPPLST